MFVGDYDTISNLDDCSDLKEMLVNSRKAEVRVLHEFDHGTFLIGRNMDWFQEVVQIFNSQIIELTKEQKKLQKLKKNWKTGERGSFINLLIGWDEFNYLLLIN